MNNQKVLVTGANGHLGNTLVKALVDKGYSVRATVRDPGDVQRAGIFEGYDIELFQADIRDPEALKKAVSGVNGIFQVAALYHYNEQQLGEGIVENNTEGSLTVLAAAKKAGIQRIVMTSSIAAVGFGGSEKQPMDENSWSDPSDPYCRSKLESERAAWKFVEENNLELITICPSLILGPNFYKHTASTVNVASFINNQVPFRIPLQSSIVDVRDVAEAHILAYENPNASGRYIVPGVHVSDFCGFLKEFDEEMILPERSLSLEEAKMFAEKSGAPTEMIGATFWYSDKKVKSELGWKSRPIEVTMTDTIRWIKQRGM